MSSSSSQDRRLPDWAEDSDTFVEHLEKKCPELFHTAYWPRTVIQEHPPKESGIAARLASKFGGLPWCSRNNKKYPHPQCQKCKEQLTLLCQLDISKLPKEFRTHIGHQNGLFQVGIFIYYTDILIL